jgi:hypothetical protein
MGWREETQIDPRERSRILDEVHSEWVEQKEAEGKSADYGDDKWLWEEFDRRVMERLKSS